MLKMYRKNQEEPVVLTLSSDEDEDGNESSNQTKPFHTLSDNNSFEIKNQSAIYEPVNPKEPTIVRDDSYDNWKLYHQNIPGAKFECTNVNDSTIFISLQCRSIRIGSYKVVPIEKILITQYEITAKVPPFAEGENNPVNLKFPIKRIRKILGHFGPNIPVLFIYVTDPVAKDIRKQLKMGDTNGFYFDPCSQEESQKRLTILPEKLKSDSINIIKNLFNFQIRDPHGGAVQLLEELDQKDANEILVRSSPVEIESLAVNSRTLVTYETRTLLIFPPPPNKGGITITMDDYCCLKDEQFLNDVMVDFFFKWLHMCHISEEDREKTLMFSTFFYKRLTTKPKNTSRSPASESDPNLSAAQKRHARVQTWTKNVDIFSKDFILIPINEQSHWFLAVICYPYLDGPVRAGDGKPIPTSEATLPTRVSSRKKKKVEIPVIDDVDGSDRDEAEGDDFEFDDDEAEDGENDMERKQRKLKPKNEDCIRQPCILILDSLSGASRSRIVSTLRDYLTVEYQKRRNKEKVFSKDTMLGACPKVPQQMNYSDCGLFTLQFAQSFFERPVKDFRLPIRSLQDWFDQDVVAGKREYVANLIKSLMDEHKPNHGITLPPISFNSNPNNFEEKSSSHIPEHSKEEMDSSQCDDEKQNDAVVSNGNAVKKLDINDKIEEGKSENSYNNETHNSFANYTSCSNSIKCFSDILDRRNATPINNTELMDDAELSVINENANSTSNSISIKNLTSISKQTLDDKVTTQENHRELSLPKSNNKINSHETKCIEKPLNKSLRLLYDNYSSVNSDDEDEIFIKSSSKKQKLSKVEL